MMVVINCAILQFFTDDINYLLTMDKLWQTRRPPVPLNIHCLPVDGMLCYFSSHHVYYFTDC